MHEYNSFNHSDPAIHAASYELNQDDPDTATVWALHIKVPFAQMQELVEQAGKDQAATGEYMTDSFETWGEDPSEGDASIVIYFNAPGGADEAHDVIGPRIAKLVGVTARTDYAVHTAGAFSEGQR